MARAPYLVGSGGQTVLLEAVVGRWMVQLGAVGTAHAPRLAGFGRWMVRFEANSTVGLPTHRVMWVWADR